MVANARRYNLKLSRGRVGGNVKFVRRAAGNSKLDEGLGRRAKAVVYAYSSAALAIANRKGRGKLRHINIG